MTTFTMQDLNNLPTTPEEDEAMEALAKLGGGVALGDMFTQMGSDLTGGKSNTFDVPNPDAIQYTHGGTLGAPEPQPTLTDIINNICTQLQLLTTIITQSKAQPEGVEEKSSSNESLQECVSLTLQQADWFKDLIRRELIGGGIEDLAKDAVQDVVESEVESYFENNFDPSYHFDFDDAVSDAVDDRIDGIVSDKIDDAVEGYMSNATITISK
jgi:hypothetical protein